MRRSKKKLIVIFKFNIIKYISSPKEVYQKVVQEATENNLKPPYHVYARLYLCQFDTVNFYQIPNSILLDFGFDLEKDKFN